MSSREDYRWTKEAQNLNEGYVSKKTNKSDNVPKESNEKDNNSNNVLVNVYMELDNEQFDKWTDFLVWLKNNRLLKNHGHESKEFEL